MQRGSMQGTSSMQEGLSSEEQSERSRGEKNRLVAAKREIICFITSDGLP